LWPYKALSSGLHAAHERAAETASAHRNHVIAFALSVILDAELVAGEPLVSEMRSAIHT
jgi:hypothetical protein